MKPHSTLGLGYYPECFPTSRGDEPVLYRLSLMPIPVFPTAVGMNRRLNVKLKIDKSVPHSRGDEPFFEHLVWSNHYVFPTAVGMNRAK